MGIMPATMLFHVVLLHDHGAVVSTVRSVDASLVVMAVHVVSWLSRNPANLP